MSENVRTSLSEPRRLRRDEIDFFKHCCAFRQLERGRGTQVCVLPIGHGGNKHQDRKGRTFAVGIP